MNRPKVGTTTPETGTSEWERMAAEPATDEEIETHKRQAQECHCLPCMDRLRLIARIEKQERDAR